MHLLSFFTIDKSCFDTLYLTERYSDIFKGESRVRILQTIIPHVYTHAHWRRAETQRTGLISYG